LDVKAKKRPFQKTYTLPIRQLFQDMELKIPWSKHKISWWNMAGSSR